MSRKGPVPVVDPSRLVLSLDTLTDGSERTGHGAIFLSVRKGPKQAPRTGAVADETIGLDSFESSVDDSDPSHSILARYAISGLPTLTARLCADQRFHLASTRAVFCPNLDPASIVGIPSLLLALNNAGAPKVFVAGPKGVDAYVERNVDLVLGRYKTFPAATTCEVPSSSEDGSGIANTSDCWWQVFEDEFIRVHAKYVVLQMAKKKKIDDDDDDDDDDIESSSDDEELSSSSSSSSGDDSSTSDEEGDTPHCRNGTDMSETLSVAYIFYCKGTETQLAILPPNLAPTSPLVSASLHPLPETVSHSPLNQAASDANNCPFSLIIFLSPHNAAAGSNEDDEKQRNIEIHPGLKAISQSFVSTVPGNDASWDEGILVRASNQARKLHRDLPFAFAANNLSRKIPVHDSQPSTGTRLELDCDVTGITRLTSCSSMIIWHGRHSFPVTSTPIDRRRCIISRMSEKKRASTPKYYNGSGTPAGDQEPRGESIGSDIAELANIYGEKLAEQVAAEAPDGNEISLDDDDDDDDDDESVEECNVQKGNSCEEISEDATKVGLDPSRAHLLVLGTGCASPSPLRGSSGYGILLPSWQQYSDFQGGNQCLCLAGLLECGEGSLSALRRYLPFSDVPNNRYLNDWLRQIRFIWISHAHLDHYSELPLMIRAIANAGGRQAGCKCRGARQTPLVPEGEARMDRPSQIGDPLGCSKCLFPPIVIAPPKVLQFLEASLACCNKESKTKTSSASRKRKHEDIGHRVFDRLYFGISNQDFDRSPFASTLRQMLFNIELPLSSSSFYRPFASLQSVPVTHCPQAFAVILNLRLPNKSFFLVYSGDTRPSQSLIQSCRRFAPVAGGGGCIDLLIHETTFDDDDQGKQNAIAKRHSTVLEAIEVAKQMDAKCCLFTHFSQRYPNLPKSATGATGSLPAVGGRAEDELKLCAAIDGLILPLTDLSAVVTRLNRCCQSVLEH